MTGRFSDAALRCAACAAQILHWPPQIFWQATPSELWASLAPPAPHATPLSRADIAQMIERDAHG